MTVATDAIPRRRPSTLSDDAFASAAAEPARGGPADRRLEEVPVPDRGVDRRTTVRSGPGVGVFAATTSMAVASASPAAGPAPARVVGPTSPYVDPGGTTGPVGSLGRIPVVGR